MATILLIDDCRSVRDACQSELNLAGYDVLTVRDGVAACRLLESINVDLVVLDVRMPGLGGPETFARLRVDHPDLPVIFHTSERQSAAITKVLGPTVKFVRKSGALDELTHAIQEALRTCRIPTNYGVPSGGLAEFAGAPSSTSFANGEETSCLTASRRYARDWKLPRQPR